MKKTLLSLLLLSFAFFAKSQVVLNEIYPDPGSTHQEFFELYNTSVTNVPVNLDCYQLVTFDKTGKGSFNVIDFPSTATIQSKSYFVGAATSPFSAQGPNNQNLTPNFSWQSTASIGTGGSIKRYTLNSAGTGYTVTDLTGTTDFFPVNTGNGTTVGVFLFNNGVLVNGFLGGVNTTSVPSDITSMLALPITTSCGNFTINWASITLAENVGSTAGNDNGYTRSNDGACGTWVKASAQVNHTPGRTNGSATGLTGALTTASLYNCSSTSSGTSTVTVNVTGATGDANAGNTLPVEVQLYYDNTSLGTLGQLDANDTYKSSISYATFTDGAKSFTIPAADRGQPVIVVFKTVLGCFDKIVALDAACIVLPVSLKSFSAARINHNVSLKWETATEQNNKGFYVQRSLPNGTWQDVAFVFSQGDRGNSSTVLSYSLNDLNINKGITQYRLLQVDMDGHGKYSEVRSVRGEEMAARLLVFPNPSSTGTINILFDDASAPKDVMVSDLAGRLVKQYSNVSGSLEVKKLKSGFYTIRVLNRSTGAALVEKVIVNER